MMPGLNLFLNNRDHRKLTVIDGKVGFTGGYNLANEYFNYTHPYGQWKDTGIRLEGEAVLEIRNDLRATMNDCQEVTEKYRTGQRAYLRLGQLFMRLFAGLL